MKKAFAVILALMLAFGMASCGGKGTKGEDTEKKEPWCDCLNKPLNNKADEEE